MDESRRSILHRPVFYLLLLLTVVALWPRLHGIERLSLWFDEGLTTWKIHRPLGEIFLLSRSDTVPPLYYYLLKSWTIALSESDFTLRLLSALIGIVSIPLVYLMGRSLLDEKTGLGAAFLLTFSTYHIQYCQEARSYTLLFLFFGLTVYFLSLIQDSPRTLYWMAYALCGTLMMYAHGISPFYLVSVNIYFLTHKSVWSKRILKSWLISNIWSGKAK